MASTASLDDIVENLPRGDQYVSGKPPTGLSYPTPNPAFVAPDLIVEKPVEERRTSVLLISAPGAVGKSTLAAEIASRKGAALWDLSCMNVGTHTFTGTLLEAYGDKALGVRKRFRAEADHDGFLVILDALDEAEVRAGSQNYETFLRELARELTAPRPVPTAVLLARTNTADWIEAILDDEDVPYARLQIALFDEARAEMFVERWLDARPKSGASQPIHREQPQPFLTARDALFDLVYSIFGLKRPSAWADARLRTFLGYAPVLEALAEYLNVPNYLPLMTEITQGPTGDGDAWRFLSEIVRRLLTREAGKTQEALRGKLDGLARELGWSEWEGLYGADEQCARILARTTKANSLGGAPSLPEPLGPAYEEALKTQVGQHPFLAGSRFANVVFKEYCYAWCLVNGNADLTARLRETMLAKDAPFLASALLGDFLVRMGGEEGPLIDGQDFGPTLDSFLARPGSLALSLVETEDQLDATVTLSDASRSEVQRIQLLDTGPGVHIWRHLSRADVEMSGRVQLGLLGQRLTLGPDLELSCGPLTLAAEEVEVDASQPVALSAASFASEAQPPRLVVRGDDSGLRVSWPREAYPWVRFRGAPEVARGVLSATRRGDALRKFLLMFKRQRTRNERTVRKARLAPDQTADRDELIELALKVGLLQPVSGRPLYSWNTAFDSLHTLLSDSPLLSAEALSFAESFLGRKAVAQLLPA